MHLISTPSSDDCKQHGKVLKMENGSYTLTKPKFMALPGFFQAPKTFPQAVRVKYEHKKSQIFY